MSTLRWIILIVGALVMTGIYLHWRFFDRAATPADGDQPPGESGERYEPTVGGHPFDALEGPEAAADAAGPGVPEFAEIQEAIAPMEDSVAPGDEAGGEPDRGADAGGGGADEVTQPVHGDGSDRQPGEAEPVPPRERILVLHVAAPEAGMLHVEDIVRALVRRGLSHGPRGAFYRYPEPRQGGRFVFCAANMLEPGSFDLRDMENMRTPGVTLMTMLPAPVPARAAVEAMVETALALARELGGRLLDERREPVTEAMLGTLYEQAVEAEQASE